MSSTWSLALLCQLAVNPPEAEGGDVYWVVWVCDAQLAGVGGVLLPAGGRPDGPAEVAVAGVARREVVVLVLTAGVTVTGPAPQLRQALKLLVVRLQQGDALVVGAVDHLVPEGRVLLTTDAAEEGVLSGGFCVVTGGRSSLHHSSLHHPLPPLDHSLEPLLLRLHHCPITPLY